MRAHNHQRGRGRWLAALAVGLLVFLVFVQRQEEPPAQPAPGLHGQRQSSPQAPTGPAPTAPTVPNGPTQATAGGTAGDVPPPAVVLDDGAPPPPPARPEITIISATLRETLAEIRFPTPVLTPVTHRGRRAVVVDMPESRPLKQADQPALPLRRWDLVLPTNGEASLEIVSLDDEIVPSPPPIPSGGFGRRPEPLPLGAFGAAYESSQPFPAEVARLTPSYQIRQLRGAGLVVHPVRYLPEAEALQIVRSVRIRVRYQPAAGADTLRYPSPPRSRAFRALGMTRFENYEETVAAAAAGTRAEGDLQNSDKLLIVVPDAWEGVLADFAQWKRQRGLHVSVARHPTDTGGDIALASYLQTAYDDDQITYVILVGDEDAIPPSEGDQNRTPSDTIYTLVAGDDHYHDMLISRVSVPTSAQAATLLAKAVAYERNPNTTDGWHARATMVASSVKSTTVGSPYNGLTDAQDLTVLGDLLTGSDLFDSYEQVYQDTPDGTTAKVSSAWNAGHGLLYYLGHGSATTWISVPYGNANVKALTNGTALPFVINSACVNGAFQGSYPCLAEAMLWGNTSEGADGTGGAIAVVGATTNMDWDPPIALLDAFTGYYLGRSGFKVGDLQLTDQPLLWDASSLTFASIQRAMDYCASANGDGLNALKLIMQQTHLFGDATLGVRTVTPRPLSVSHADTVSPGSGLTVAVTDPTRGAVAAAIVTLTDATGKLSVTTTDATGTATVPATTFTIGSNVTLTVYERNSVPYQQGDLPVGDGTVVITPAYQPSIGFVNEAYSHTFLADAGTTPYTWSVSVGTLPPGMALNEATGQFSGTPPAAETFSFTVRVTDSAAGPDQDELAVSWTVGHAVQIAAQDLAGGTVGTPYSATASATGSFTPYTFSLPNGGLPPGLSLGADGSVAGTPTRQGDYTFTVQATDAQGRTDQAAVGIAVAPAAEVTILTTDLPDTTIGVAYSAQLAAAGGSGGGYLWEITSGALPVGLTLAAGGLIEGTPTTVGTGTFTVQVTDDAVPPRVATQELTLFVGLAAYVTTTSLPSAYNGVAYESQITAVGSSPPFTFAAPDYRSQTVASTFAEDGVLRTDWVGDEVYHDLDLGFTFPYFGNSYTSCRISDNGFVVFGPDAPTDGSSGDAWNALSSRLDSYRMIAPFWDDMVIQTSYPDTGIWLTQQADSVTIRWRGLDFNYTDNPDSDPLNDENPDLVNVSLTLHADGNIVFHYGAIRTTNRVVVGLGDADDGERIVELAHEEDVLNYLAGWSESEDRTYAFSGTLPPGLALAADGTLAGTPTESGTFSFSVVVTDASGATSAATLTLVVLETQADTNGDGDTDSAEILAYIERWHAGEVLEADVEAAVLQWQLGPPAARRATRADNAPVPERMKLIVTFDDKGTLDQLVDRGLVITAVRDGQAYVHATAEERAWLAALGLPVAEETTPVTRVAPTTYDELAAQLQTMADNNPTLCRLEQIGTSVDGKAILALVISDNPQAEEDEPEVRVVAGIHGDERLGEGVAFRLAEWLLANYGGTDADGLRATALVDSTELWVLPILNPDGWEADRRENSNGQDLNRSFPDGVEGTVGTVFAEGAPDTSGLEPEVAAFMAWTAACRFTLGTVLHTGAKLVCYPYGNHSSGSSVYSASPDDALFIDLAHAYVDNHPDMGTAGTVTDGIINSCYWYRVVGELPDWAYRYTGGLEITVELTVADAPLEDPAWTANQASLLAFVEYAQRGVRGVVRDAITGDPLSASIQIAGNDREVYTDPDVGDFHRVLLPGTYDVTISAPGYLTQTVTGVVVPDGAAARLDLDLTLDGRQHCLYRQFATTLYVPDAQNAVSLQVDVDEAAPPNAFIIAETLPEAWTYQVDSAAEAESGTALAAARIDGNTVSWLFWRTDVRDRQFGYTAFAPPIRSDTAVFGGSLTTVAGSVAATGDITWLAQTENRFALELAVGWNLLSLPLEPSDRRRTSVFGDSSGIAVWAWDPASLRYYTPAVLVPKEGYWVHAPAADTLVIEGNAPAENERDFTEGWNLFGPLDERSLLDEIFLQGDTVEWSGDSYRAASNLLPCHGYWIHAALPGRASLR